MPTQLKKEQVKIKLWRAPTKKMEEGYIGAWKEMWFTLLGIVQMMTKIANTYMTPQVVEYNEHMHK